MTIDHDTAPSGADSPETEKPKSKRLFFFLRLFVSFALVGVLLAVVGWRDVWNILAQMQVAPFVAACALFFVGQILAAYRWRCVLASWHEKLPGMRYLTGLFLIGLFFNFFLPSTVGGDVVRAEIVRPYLKGRSASYSGVFLDRFIAFFAVLLIGIVAIAFAYLVIGWIDLEVVLSIAVFAVIGFGVILAIRLPVLRTCLRWFERGRLAGMVEKVNRILVLLHSGVGDRGMISRAFLVSLVIQIVSVNGVVVLLAMALSLDVPLYFHFIAVPIITLVTLLPVSFNGIGVREVSFAFFYGKIGLAADAAVGLSFSWMLVLLVMALIGGLCMCVPRLYKSPAQLSP